MSRYSVLIAKSQNELIKIAGTVQSALSQSEKAKNTGDKDYWLAAAFSLQNFYMGTERIFEEIAKQVEATLPTGAGSHRELLEQMALEIPNVRPSVILGDTLDRLNEYRGFRHVSIHRYGSELRSDRIRELTEALPDCHTLLVRDMGNFCQFLQVLEQPI